MPPPIPPNAATITAAPDSFVRHNHSARHRRLSLPPPIPPLATAMTLPTAAVTASADSPHAAVYASDSDSPHAAVYTAVDDASARRCRPHCGRRIPIPLNSRCFPTRAHLVATMVKPPPLSTLFLHGTLQSALPPPTDRCCVSSATNYCGRLLGTPPPPGVFLRDHAHRAASWLKLGPSSTLSRPQTN